MPEQPAASRTELYAGVGLLALLAVTLALGAFDVVKKAPDLRPLRVGDDAPAFSLSSPSGGQKVALDQFRGQVVLLDFWATWCPPCMREMPELNALHGELQSRGFSVVGINREPEDVRKVSEFVAKQGISFPIAVDTDGTGERYRVLSLPTTVLVGRNGKVLQMFMGYTDAAVMKSAALAALDAKD